MRSKATLKNISEKLSISISTVSRALKNHPDIAESTRKKVKELAALLDYEPNPFAINLRTNESRLLGVLVPVISNYFYESFIASLEEETRSNGYTLMILQSGDDPLVELQNLKLCRLNRVAGVFACITPHTGNIEPFLKMEESGVPVIFFDKVPVYEACNKVCMADAEAATLAAQKIIEHKKDHVLAIFGNSDLSITRKRQAAFEEVFAAQAPGTRMALRNADSREMAFRYSLEYLEQNGDGVTIFCMSDEILTGVMKAVQRLKKSVPSQVSVISISAGIMPSLYEPEITYAETSGVKLGKLAFKRMMEYMQGRTFTQEVILGSQLVEGRSM
jgi:LacI family transcriptional regulator